MCIRPASQPSTPSLLPIIQTANLSRKEKKRRQKQDPYGWAQAQQRKAANLKRREELQKVKDAAWGSPVHGITTPFVESFDTAGQAPLSTPRKDADGNPIEEPHPLPTSPELRNFLLKDQEVEKAIEQSYLLTKPLEPEDRTKSDPALERKQREEHERHHAKAVAVLQRVTDLGKGSAKDRRHANIQRCIETFGRHRTDEVLPNPAPPRAAGVKEAPKPRRAGPDTGSSEVQIAILTAKIRGLAQALEGYRGYRDKNNKRSLRRLCHKRQRLLKYMERKERGSGRWQHMIETLGLSPATWKEQITL